MIRREDAAACAPGHASPGLQPEEGPARGLFLSRSAPLRAAYAFAAEAHSGQRQESDGSAYIEHPVAVARLLEHAGFGVEVVTAGLLHDTVEDAEVTVADLERRFGGSVAALVAALTEPENPSDFAARKASHRGQIAEAGAEAAAIFAADKIANVQNLRRAVARDGEARVVKRLSNPLSQKLEHYRKTLEMLNGLPLSLSLAALLRDELNAFDAECSRAARAAESAGLS